MSMMEARINPQTALWLLLSLMCIPLSLCNRTCIEGERDALLHFKAGLLDPSGRLSSWSGALDCCLWEGVRCSRRTGHVVRLHLRNPDVHLDDDYDDFKSRAWLGGEINESLLRLKRLNHLDLSLNYFGGSPIPPFIGSLKRLRHLNLSSSCFGSEVPPQIGNLSLLLSLDLSQLYFFDNGNINSDGEYCGVSVERDQWLSRLSSLEHLNLDGARVRSGSTFFQSLNSIPSLLELHLSRCSMDTQLPSLMSFNSTSLRLLDLSYNRINSTVPPWLFGLKNLEYLDLSGNSFQGLIPEAIGNLTSLNTLLLSSSFPGGAEIRIPATLRNLCSLNELDLSDNHYPHNFHDLGEAFSGCISGSLETLFWSGAKLGGHLPEWLGMLKNLKHLYLSRNSIHGPIPLSLPSSLRTIILLENQLNGTVPERLGQVLSELVALDLSENKLQGELVEAHFAGLARLELFDVSSNNISLGVGPDWSPPPLLTSIGFASCNLGPQFPPWLQKLKNISYIDLRRTGISGVMPDWFWNFSSAMRYIDMAGNAIKGQLPRSLEHLDLESFDLSNNQLEGPLPLFSSGLQEIYLSNNSFSGVIPPRFWKKGSSLYFLDLSANNLSGSIHYAACEPKHLYDVDLSHNHLSGKIPDCWKSSSMFNVLHFGNNHLSGSIPNSIGSLPYLLSLQVDNNNLSGSIPKSIGSLSKLQALLVGNNNLSGELPLLNCPSLAVLDLGQNKFSGNFPVWIGKELKELLILRLRANMFTGTIPDELGSLPFLFVIDLALNNLSGVIPRSFGNLIGIRFAREYQSNGTFRPFVSVILDFRGREDEYFNAPATIDLAGNSLYGAIPEEIATLYGLQNLNLSGNHLTGNIPKKISKLRQLESLDLSFNILSGPIPADMIAMSFLDHLNLSFNNLSGQIPFGGQFEALPYPSIYTGNNDLCGYPLNVTCNGGGGGGASQVDDDGEDGHNESEIPWFYMSMSLGFVFGFWAFCGTLLLHRKWRIAFFRSVDTLIGRLDVAVAVNLAKIGSYWFS